MEQPVWVYFGIIISLFALVIVSNVILDSQEQAKGLQVSNAVKKLGEMCSFVCRSEMDTLLTERIELPSGAALKASRLTQSICAQYRGAASCVQCPCAPANYDLNLDTPEHLQAFSSASFECSFERLAAGVKIGCKG
ncbi:MAG TPA: hypothetical protein HA254_04310 [Candidatus Diapherotrites archaeon]|uniref:Uncharacterized protein n=1 Tax=Candidatus Iainarchaeum sp. TaxID=3101447 RepID=A0A7J4J1D6_9ARCH|nr:hypothetical protein [Candidatus Diapherotrites archaeon]